MSDGNVASAQLRQFVERAERVKEEIKAAQDDLKDVFAEAKSQGFDVATIKTIIKLRAMKPDARREAEALLDTYKAALGMLDGTPLGHWALERLKPKKPASEEPEDKLADDASTAEVEDDVADVEQQPTEDDARRMGTEAAKAGQPVTSNPFPARDARRAAWDEAWCSALGTDGMDIPDAWKPQAKKKPDGKEDEK